MFTSLKLLTIRRDRLEREFLPLVEKLKLAEKPTIRDLERAAVLYVKITKLNKRMNVEIGERQIVLRRMNTFITR